MCSSGAARVGAALHCFTSFTSSRSFEPNSEHPDAMPVLFSAYSVAFEQISLEAAIGAGELLIQVAPFLPVGKEVLEQFPFR